MTKKTNQSISERPKYSPTPQEQAAIEKSSATLRAAAPAPRLKVGKKGITFDHPDDFVARVLLKNALGGLDKGFTDGLLKHLARAAQTKGKADEEDLNF